MSKDAIVDLTKTKLKYGKEIKWRAGLKQNRHLQAINEGTFLKDKKGKDGTNPNKFNRKSILAKIGDKEIINANTNPPEPWKDIQKPPVWAELLEQELPDGVLLDKHKQLLENTNARIQMEALKEAYRIKGKIAPERVEHSFRPFEQMEDDELDQKLVEAERAANREKKTLDIDVEIINVDPVI